MTDEDAPCLIPVCVSKTSEILPKPRSTHLVTEYIDLMEQNITLPIPSLISCCSSKNLETRSKALDRSKNPMYSVSFFSKAIDMMIRSRNIWSIHPFPF